MENNLIFEDIYEPIKFQMKNQKGEVFDCQTQFLSVEDNMEIEKMVKLEFDENGNIKGQKDKSVNEKLLELMVKQCGQTQEFWRQFSYNGLTTLMSRLNELEREKYKKKLEKK